MNIIREFELTEHPALQHRMDCLRARGKHRIGSHEVHGLVRSIFYRYDLPTMFDSLADLSGAIKASKEAFKIELDARLADPLGACRNEKGSEVEKADGCKTHYALEHFKANQNICFKISVLAYKQRYLYIHAYVFLIVPRGSTIRASQRSGARELQKSGSNIPCGLGILKKKRY